MSKVCVCVLSKGDVDSGVACEDDRCKACSHEVGMAECAKRLIRMNEESKKYSDYERRRATTSDAERRRETTSDDERRQSTLRDEDRRGETTIVMLLTVVALFDDATP